jgi:cell division protein FtsB
MSQSGQGDTSNTTDTDGAQDGGNGTGGAGTGSQDNTTDTGSAADGAQQDAGTSDGKDTVSRADFDRLQSQLSAADKRREALEQENKDLKAKDLSELEKAQQEAKDAQTKVTELEAEVSTLRLSNAFLAANTITWQNGEVALDIARSKGYLEDVTDDKGVVDTKKMGVALKRLAEEHKYLVKTQDDSDDSAGQGSGDGKQGASGQSGPRGKNSSDDKAKTERLKSTFPALGRR